MFDYYQPTRLHFGFGRVSELGDICQKYGKTCVLVTTADQFMKPLCDNIKNQLERVGIECLHFDKVVPNPTIEIVNQGLDIIRKKNIDFMLPVGGGSSIDTAKAIAFAYNNPSLNWDEAINVYTSFQANYEEAWPILPIISVPTTSGTGSHVTHAAVLSFGKEKLTLFHPALFSKEAIIDPELMLTLPAKTTAATAFDAFTHAFESYVSEKSSPYSEMDSMGAITRVIKYLPLTLKDPSNKDYRYQLALADTLGGKALSNAGALTPHPLAEVIGGLLNIPHDEALAIVYPSFIKHSVTKYEKKFESVAKCFDEQATAQDLEKLLSNFIEKMGLLAKLSDYGMSQESFNEMCKHPVFDFLPYGDRDYFIRILNDAY